MPVPIYYASGGTYHWMEQFNCPVVADRGVELDFLTFFYELNNKSADAFSLKDIADVFIQACGGICDYYDGDNEKWIPLVNAARAKFGAGSAKALYFENTGRRHGVAH